MPKPTMASLPLERLAVGLPAGARVPNWLDCGGYTSGQIDQRWVEVFEGEEYPEFQTKVVKLGDLDASLPPDVRRIDREGRAQQVRRRKIGVDKRFPV